MSSRAVRGLRTALLLATTCLAVSGLSANAADLGVKKPGVVPIMAEFNPWMVRVRGLGVVPGGSNKVIVGGAGFAGGKVDMSDSIVPELDITYFFTKNIAAELILGTTPHTAKGKGTLTGFGTLGKTWLLPPTLTLQYHFTNFGAFKPYIGAGVNYTLFYGHEHGALNHFRVQNTAGLAAQVGFDYMIDQHWGFNVDVKKLYLRTTAKGSLAGTPVKAKMELDPWIFGVGVTYKF